MKSARYHALRDRVLAHVDHVFAEPVRLSPMGTTGADPERAQVEIEAVLRVGGGKETSAAGSASRSWRTRISAQKAELHIDRSRYPGLIVHPKDKVRALSRHGEPGFIVLAIDDRSTTRLVLQLGEAR